jgi:circadian clock protein KaiC
METRPESGDLRAKELSTRNLIMLQPTGIEGLDQLLGGGIPRGSVVLVAGNPGTGKTTFAAKFLYEGAKAGEPGIYVSFVEPRRDFVANMKRLGMDFEELERKGLFYFMEALTVGDREALSSLLDEILTKAMEVGAKRIAIDSVSAILQILRSAHAAREVLHNFFLRVAKSMGVTTILIAELPIGAHTVGFGIEEFIVDGVIILKMRLEKGRIVRFMELRKMRGAPLTLAELTFRITPGAGIEVRVPVLPEKVPSLDHDKLYGTGVEEMDKWFLGGFPKGSQVLFIIHPLLDPTLFMSFIATTLYQRYGGPVLYRSYRSSPETIKMVVCRCLEGCRDGLPRDFHVVTRNPTLMSITDLAALNISEERSIRPRFVFIEGLDLVLELLADVETYKREHFNNILIRKSLGVTAFYSFAAIPRQPDQIPLINVYDSVFYVRPRRMRVRTEDGMVKYKVFVEIIPFRHSLGMIEGMLRLEMKQLETCRVDVVHRVREARS